MAEKQQKHKRMTAKNLLCLAAALLFLSAAVSSLVTAKAGDSNRMANFIRGAFSGGGDVQNGTLEVEGLEMPSEIPEGEIRYFINQEILFPNAYEKGDIVFQNPEKCGYVLQLFVYLADGSSSHPIYTSPKLQPGQYLNEDKLDRYLKAGKYACTYTVKAFSLEDGKTEEGYQSGFLTMTVVN